MRFTSEFDVCARHRFRVPLALIALLIGLTGCASRSRASSDTPNAPSATRPSLKKIAGDSVNPAKAPLPVKLDIFLMSKCPFAAQTLNAVLSIMNRMEGRIDLNLYYIGQVIDQEFSSMRGKEEVEGDMLQLCAADVGNREKMRRFIACQLEDFRRIPSDWETCASSAGLDLSAMRACREGERGRSLLEDSFKQSQERGINASPTILVNGEQHNGLRTESALSRLLCRTMPAPKAPYCEQIPALVKFPIIVLEDKRCTGRDCLTGLHKSNVAYDFEGAEVRHVDYSSDEGRALYERSNEKYLPMVIYGADVVKDVEGYEKLKSRVVPFGDTNDFVFPIGKSWDPTAEICDDGVDNTDDGRIDCADPTCKAAVLCREEKKRHLDMFLTPHCTYARRALPEVMQVLDEFKKKKSSLDLELVFLGHFQNGKPVSMFGSDGTIESLRQACAQKHYKQRHKFMEYVVCRAEHEEGDEWKQCVAKGMSAEVIEKCADGKEGAALFSESIRKAEALKISSSPFWFINNRFEASGFKTKSQILEEFCAHNKDADACDNF